MKITNLVLLTLLFSCSSIDKQESESQQQVFEHQEFINKVSQEIKEENAELVEVKKEMKQEAMQRQELGNIISLLIPSDFTMMSTAEKSVKYPGQNAPQEVWANAERDININFSNTGQALPISELEMYINEVANGIKANVPSSKWYEVKSYTYNGIKVGVLEFITPARDGEIYNLMCFTSINGKLIMYSFNCLAKNKTIWQEKAQNIISSIKQI